MVMIFSPQHRQTNPFGSNSGMSAASANEQYTAGLGNTSHDRFRVVKPQFSGGNRQARVAPAPRIGGVGQAAATAAQPSVSQMAANVAGGVPNYQTSIDAKEIWNPQQKTEAMNQARTSAVHAYQNPSSAFAQNQVSANTRMGAGSGFARAQADNAGLMSKFLGERNASEADRAMTAQNASHLLASQQARAGEGLSLAGMLQQEKLANQAQQFQREQSAQNMGMNLISTLLSGIL